LDSIFLFAATVIGSVLIILAIARFWPEWRNYAVAAVTGLGVGSAIIGIAVWTYSQIFFSPVGIFRAPAPIYFTVLWFVWTFATEIPFILILGPPVIKICYKAFPSLEASRKPESREK